LNTAARRAPRPLASNPEWPHRRAPLAARPLSRPLASNPEWPHRRAAPARVLRTWRSPRVRSHARSPQIPNGGTGAPARPAP